MGEGGSVGNLEKALDFKGDADDVDCDCDYIRPMLFIEEEGALSPFWESDGLNSFTIDWELLQGFPSLAAMSIYLGKISGRLKTMRTKVMPS